MVHLMLAAIAIAAASPSPSPAPSAPPDPCASISSIVTRPSVSTSVCTVRDGHALVETGYTNTTTTGTGGWTTFSFPQTYVRLGIGRATEISFSPPSYNRSSLGSTFATGSSDMNFGAKWEIGYNAKGSWGVNALISAPTGDPAFTAGGTQYTANLNGSYTVNPVISVGGTLGFDSFVGANAQGVPQRYAAFAPSLIVTASFPNSFAFAEYAYVSHAGPNVRSKDLIDAGYARDFGAHVQIDVEFGFQPTLVNGQRTHYVGAGLSLMQ